MYQLYWGDLHSHCSISYGHGSVAQALARARQQLDFCSITGHAFWPDMPTDRSEYADIIDYHTTGFARLSRNWDKLIAAQANATVEGEFIAFPSYEWHSLEYGDHNVYAMGPMLPLAGAPDLPGLRRCGIDNGAIVIPHHIGYAAGYRGIDWNHFHDEQSPFVEIFSLHGCSESESAPYPMLHDMGPRDAGSTAVEGWRRGYRFGVIGSTDHHSAYPGSHGDGRIGVFATKLTREALWEALLARRVYSATGDGIDARFFVDDAWIGSTVRAPAKRRLRVAVSGADALDRVEVLKNEKIVRRCFPSADAVSASGNYRLRITWGWGRKETKVRWQAKLSLSDGEIQRIETCFAGPPVVAPIQQIGDAEVPDEEDLPHALIERGPRACVWRSQTAGNPSMRHGTTQAISLQLTAPLDSAITLEVNNKCYRHPLSELLSGGRSHYLRGWLSEAIRIGPLVALEACRVAEEWEDSPERDVDYYRLRAAQRNGQWVWLSPIWVER